MKHEQLPGGIEPITGGISLVAMIACLALTACAAGPAPEPRVVVQRVEVAVPVHCNPAVGPDPAYPDNAAALAAAPDIFERVKLVMAGRLMRIQREVELKAALGVCAGS